MLENKFSIFGRDCFLRSRVRTVRTSTVLIAAICTNWVTTLCMSDVGDLGSYIT